MVLPNRAMATPLPPDGRDSIPYPFIDALPRYGSGVCGFFTGGTEGIAPSGLSGDVSMGERMLPLCCPGVYSRGSHGRDPVGHGSLRLARSGGQDRFGAQARPYVQYASPPSHHGAATQRIGPDCGASCGPFRTGRRTDVPIWELVTESIAGLGIATAEAGREPLLPVGGRTVGELRFVNAATHLLLDRVVADRGGCVEGLLDVGAGHRFEDRPA